MQKYYLSKVIGTGSSRDPYRVAAADVVSAAGVAGAGVLAFIPVDPATGVPTRTEVLCIAEAPGNVHAQLAGDAVNHFQLPDPTLLKIKMASIASQVQNAMNARASNAAFNVNFTANSFADWVNGIGAQCDPAFDVNKFTVA